MAKYTRKSFIRDPEIIEDRFLGYNPLPKIRSTSSDEVYVIDNKYDERPDLLAYQIYGDSKLWWVFGLRNPDIIKDPIRDFKAGKSIILPSELAVKQATGG